MDENPQKTCPFLIKSGCRVYPDRPDTCRSFPIKQGMLFDVGREKETPVDFFRPPDFCQGQFEKKRVDHRCMDPRPGGRAVPPDDDSLGGSKAAVSKRSLGI